MHKAMYCQDDKANIRFLTYGADGKPVSKSLNSKDKMIEGLLNGYDPLKALGA